MAIVKVEREIGGRTLTIETGRWARQAAGSVVITYGETVVLVGVVTAKPREGIDFFPLTVDYREKVYAAGKFPGGFFKREGRPTTKEILTMRMTDRPLRPMFPDAFRDELLIQAMVLSADQQNDPDLLSVNGASAATAIAGVPYECPVGSVRIGQIDGQLVVNPTHAQLEYSDLEVVVVGHKNGINMIECQAHQLPEARVAEAVELGYQHVRTICGMIDELRSQAAKPCAWNPPAADPKLMDRIRERAKSRIREAKTIALKQERYKAVNAVFEEVVKEFCAEVNGKPQHEKGQIMGMLDLVEGEVLVENILENKQRSDGRRPDEIRPLDCQVAVLPRVHGSAVFARGETQALVVTTLGTGRDEQIIDGLNEEYSKKFMLHYNFPPIATGEVKRVGAVSRREIGHGALAEKALEVVLPSPDKFPYTIRVVSDILESNGSSSMASVCGGTLALMDAGVPISQPVAGISIGMVHDDRRHVLLTDILGEEDHHGDMDFKVAGTQRGITAIQLDLKSRGLTMDVVRETLEAARVARLHILREMLRTLDRPRTEISPYAPRLLTVRINPEKIGKVIGPGGKGIKGIEAATGATIEIDNDGTVQIACMDMDGAERARAMVEALAEEVKVGKVYEGKVISLKDFGAFIELFPGTDGLCHISELSTDYVKNVNDVCNVGDVMKVKVILVDAQGRVKLSRKAVMEEERRPAVAQQT